MVPRGAKEALKQRLADFFGHLSTQNDATRCPRGPKVIPKWRKRLPRRPTSVLSDPQVTTRGPWKSPHGPKRTPSDFKAPLRGSLTTTNARSAKGWISLRRHHRLQNTKHAKSARGVYILRDPSGANRPPRGDQMNPKMTLSDP